MRAKLFVVSLVAALAVVGCGNTIEGLQKDTAIDAKATAAGLNKAASDLKQSGSNLGAEATLSPKINEAISKDKRLNNSANKITVHSTDEKVTLSGHVTRATLKALAGHLAANVLHDSNAKQQLDNQLQIQS